MEVEVEVEEDPQPLSTRTEVEEVVKSLGRVVEEAETGPCP